MATSPVRPPMTGTSAATLLAGTRDADLPELDGLDPARSAEDLVVELLTSAHLRGSVLVQPLMRARIHEVADVLAEDALQVILAEDEDVVEALAPDGYEEAFADGALEEAWVHDCHIIGGGRHVNGSNPVHHDHLFTTDTYIYDVDRAVGTAPLSRGLTIEHIGEDAFQNAQFVVNIRLNDQDPGDIYWHADAYQS